jgi:hypothetical protein
MKREELFSLADKVGLGFIRHASDKDIEKFEGLVKLVAFNEREALCKAMEDQIGWDMYDPASTAIEVIRARGQA